MNIKDIQQLDAASTRTVNIITSPIAVRVHECLEYGIRELPNRFFVSVGGKLRECDALRDQMWTGFTKRDANARAKELANAISDARCKLDRHVKIGEPSLIRQSTARLENLVKRYCAEV